MIEQEQMDAVRFGIEVESFLAGKIGNYLVNRAREEVSEAVEQLKKVAPTDVLAITSLQNSIYRAENFEQWLAEAVQEGWHAETQLREE